MVLLKAQVSNQHFKSFYQENFLLIQLMLKELNEICTLTPTIQLPQVLELSDQESWLLQLNSYLMLLVGEHDEGAFSNCENGPLARLKSYCQNFQLIDLVQDKSLVGLSYQVNHLYLHAKQLWHLTHSFNSTNIQRKKESFLNKIQKNVQLILVTIENTLKAFLTCLKKFRDNENVLFFLLRKKSLLVKIYGGRTTSQLFEAFSKKECLASLLIKRFKSRGFDHLLPIIKRELFFYESSQSTNS